MKVEKTCYLRSKDCPEGMLFEAGDEIPAGFARRIPEEKAPKKKLKKKATQKAK